jgi:hypothetical protein
LLNKINFLFIYDEFSIWNVLCFANASIIMFQRKSALRVLNLFKIQDRLGAADAERAMEAEGSGKKVRLRVELE